MASSSFRSTSSSEGPSRARKPFGQGGFGRLAPAGIRYHLDFQTIDRVLDQLELGHARDAQHVDHRERVHDVSVGSHDEIGSPADHRIEHFQPAPAGIGTSERRTTSPVR